MIEKLILGTVQLGIPYGISNSSGQPSIEESFSILNHANVSGISILDTAEAYGTAHEVIGKYHLKYPNQKFQIITKLPHQFTTSISVKIHDYLKELKVNRLFGLLFHSFSSYLENENNMNELTLLKENKKIENIGVSVYTNTEFETVINDDRIDIIQLPYNVFDNTNLRGELIKLAKQKGKLIHTRSCFLQGLFFQETTSEKPIVKALKPELDKLKDICSEFGKSIEEVTLNYCLQEKNIDNVLIGVDSLDQLKHNIQIADITLNSTILDKLNTIQIKKTELLNPSIWNSL
jgi:aryl-alcohol dehydrogenase-like predicted oxidoreductase